MSKRRPKAGYPWNYPWAITLSIGTPEGGSPSNGSPAPSGGGSSGGPIAESFDYDYHETKSLGDALRKHYMDHASSLSPEHSEAINSYTKHSGNLNGYLFDKKNASQTGSDFTPQKAQEDRAGSISNAIANSRPYPSGFTAYSGLHSSIHPEVIKHNGEIFHLPKFLSSSTDPSIAARFADKVGNERHILKFDIPENHKHGMFVGHVSHADDEDEYLIDKDRMVHVGDKISSHTNQKGITTHVWQAKLLDDHEAAHYASKNSFAAGEHKSWQDSQKSRLFEAMVEDSDGDQDDIEVPNLDKGLGKSRYTLPQIKKEDFFADIGKDGYRRETANPADLIPTQKHFDFDKVRGMRDSGDPLKPIIVSSDNFVVDGHHTWLAKHARSQTMEVFKVNKKIKDLLEFLKDKPYVMTKKLNESNSFEWILQNSLFEAKPNV